VVLITLSQEVHTRFRIRRVRKCGDCFTCILGFVQRIITFLHDVLALISQPPILHSPQQTASPKRRNQPTLPPPGTAPPSTDGRQSGKTLNQCTTTTIGKCPQKTHEGSIYGFFQHVFAGATCPSLAETRPSARAKP